MTWSMNSDGSRGGFENPQARTWTALGRSGRSVLMAAVVAVCGMSVLAQTPSGTNATGQAAQPATKSTHVPAHKKKPRASKVVAEPAPVEVHPPDPPPPDWPVNATAERASVGWNGRDLTIAATNSSLQQILNDVSTATGVKVEGFSSNPGDQRIYGSYGPANTRDVLSKLLDGSGYNVLMIGDKGEGTPRELVLTAKAHGAGVQAPGGQSHQNQNVEEDIPDEQPEPPPPPADPQPDPMHRPVGTIPQNHTPQQILQEMQQRQQQQQQQQQQQGTPPQQPN